VELPFRVDGRRVLLSIASDPDGRRRAGSVDAPIAIESFEIGERFVVLRTDGRAVRLLYQIVGGHIHVAFAGRSYEFVPSDAADEDDAATDSFTPEIIAPMPGKVLDVTVEAGQTVAADQALLLLEAMKMEQTIRAPAAAEVVEVRVRSGQMVGPGQVLVLLRPADGEEL